VLFFWLFSIRISFDACFGGLVWVSVWCKGRERGVQFVFCVNIALFALFCWLFSIRISSAACFGGLVWVSVGWKRREQGVQFVSLCTVTYAVYSAPKKCHISINIDLFVLFFWLFSIRISSAACFGGLVWVSRGCKGHKRGVNFVSGCAVGNSVFPDHKSALSSSILICVCPSFDCFLSELKLREVGHKNSKIEFMLN